MRRRIFRPTGVALIREIARNTRGAISVEFAFLVGLVIAVILGTLEIGQAIAARNEMSHALSRAVRVVHLNDEATTEEIADMVRADLDEFGEGDIDVTISALSGTNFMRILVSFPHEVSIPLVPVRHVNLRVETLAPMVSPSQ